MVTGKRGYIMDKNAKIYVAGHHGMVGSAIVKSLLENDYHNIIVRNKDNLDLTRQDQVEKFFLNEGVEYVFLAAAKVGGIMANSCYPADFMYENMMIELNVIKSAFESKVKKLLFLGSSCIYPKMAAQPIKEDYLLTGQLEETNEAYALAKISGLKYCEYLNKQYGTNFISVMPTNLYGLNDNYHPTNSHVIAAMLHKMHLAKINKSKEVILWGSGKPLREFLYSKDLAEACIYLMNYYSESETVNIGTGKEISIEELAKLVKDIVGYEGNLVFDNAMPDGTPRKRLDISKLESLGWKYQTKLKDGIVLTYLDYLERYKK